MRIGIRFTIPRFRDKSNTKNTVRELAEWAEDITDKLNRLVNAMEDEKPVKRL